MKIQRERILKLLRLVFDQNNIWKSINTICSDITVLLNNPEARAQLLMMGGELSESCRANMKSILLQVINEMVTARDLLLKNINGDMYYKLNS